MKKLSTKEFIDKASIKHNGRYGYDFVNYVNSQTPVIITCPIHGNFEQKPAKHLFGHGCPECNGTKRKTIKEFVQQARQIHGDKYDYSKVEYFNNTTKVEIICPEHGSFKQTPVHHINCRCGCPKCNMSHGEEFLMNYFKDANIEYISQYEVSVPSNIRITGKIFVDFYLPEYNTFVEYNGKQHYIMQKGFGGQLKFDAQLNRDNYLRAYCKENSIRLIEIFYEEKDIIGYLKSKL